MSLGACRTQGPFPRRASAEDFPRDMSAGLPTKPRHGRKPPRSRERLCHLKFLKNSLLHLLTWQMITTGLCASSH